MFSGKSEELIRRITRSMIARIPVQTFKPAVDDRYAEARLVSHSRLEVEAQPVGDSEELLGSIEDATEIVGIDEGQFFDDGLIEVCESLAFGGKQVIVAGLDLDYLGRPFDPIPGLVQPGRVRHQDTGGLPPLWGPRRIHPADRRFRRPGGARCHRGVRGALPPVLPAR